MLVHSVYFWLKPELTEAQRQAFRAGVESLGGIASVAAAYVGAPAATVRRPVIDASYDVGLTVLLEDIEQHDAYQEDPIHTAFVTEFKDHWSRLVVYDAE